MIQIAFGETEAKDAAESAVNPRLAEYREIRQGLNLLKDVPEDQLSKERLRTAILTRGLSTSRPPRRVGYSLATMATAACVLAFGIVTFNRMNPAAPTLVEDPNTMATVASLDPTLIEPSIGEEVSSALSLALESAATVVADVRATAKSIPALERSSTRTASSSAKRRLNRSIDKTDKSEESLVALGGANEEQPEQLVTSVATNNAPEPVSSTPEAPIVLIEPSPDSAGTRATERETFTNVLVGG